MKEICAGILTFHPKTKRILLGLRSDNKNWSTFGGHFEEKDITVIKTASREFKEETLCSEPYKISKEPIYIYNDNFITFYTFLGIFEKIFEPKIDEEHLDYGWFKLDELPENILPGCKEMIDKKMPFLLSVCNVYKS